VVTILKLAAAVYLGYAFLLYLFQRTLSYHGTRLPAPHPDAAPEDAHEVDIDASVGRVPAWWFPSPEPGRRPAVIVAHGNADLIPDNVAMARRLRELGVGVLLVEYPGFGLGEGSPTRASIAEVFTLAWDWLVERPEVDRERIVGLGRSVGGGAITDLAVARPVRAMVLQSTFYSLRSMVARSYLMPPFLVRDDFDNAANLRTWRGPVLILHGERDRVVSIGHAERLASVRDGIRLLRFECGHNDCPWTREDVLEEFRVFLVDAGVLSSDSRGSLA
jgi:fermentation-respiration switch protein FrsA (DUF1100 family)